MVSTTADAVAVEGDADTRAGTDGIPDQDESKTVVTRKEGDKSGCCAGVEDCSTASLEVAPTSCDEPHELLEASEHVLESVSLWPRRSWARWMRVLIGDSWLVLKRPTRVVAPIEEGLRAAFARRTPPSMSALRVSLRIEERALQSIVKGLAVTS